LRIEVEDIYFLTSLPRRGEVVNLKSLGAGSGMKIEEYINAQPYKIILGCLNLIESWFNHLKEFHKKKTNTWKLASSSGFIVKMGMLGLIFVGMDGKIGS
jgi:hypothetical protein